MQRRLTFSTWLQNAKDTKTCVMCRHIVHEHFREHLHLSKSSKLSPIPFFLKHCEDTCIAIETAGKQIHCSKFIQPQLILMQRLLNTQRLTFGQVLHVWTNNLKAIAVATYEPPQLFISNLIKTEFQFHLVTPWIFYQTDEFLLPSLILFTFSMRRNLVYSNNL